MDVASQAFIFDVDGVLTDDSATIDARVIAAIQELGSRGASLGFVSGRSTAWLEVHLLPSLAAGAGAWAGALPLGAEMGALTRRGLRPGPWRLSPEFVVPDACRDELRAICDAPELSPFVEWDASKRATATVEAIHRPGDEVHTRRTRDALIEVERLARPIARKFGCHTAMASYAVDVLAPTLTKAVGAAFALEGLPLTAGVHVVGDSTGDLAMAQAAQVAGYSVVFAWVGPGEPPFSSLPLLRPPGLHAEATLRYLEGCLGA